jgi:hypothetical protein
MDAIDFYTLVLGKKTLKRIFSYISFFSAKLKRTETAIEEYRTEIDTRKAENYGFASMAAVPYAHVVAKIIGGKHPKGTDVSLAPNPKDIVCFILWHACFVIFHFVLLRFGGIWPKPMLNLLKNGFLDSYG